MSRTNNIALKIVLIALLAGALCSLSYAQSLDGSKSAAQVEQSDSPDQKDPRSVPERSAKATMSAEEKTIRDVYARLMRYHTAAKDEQAATSGRSNTPEDYVTFEIRNIQTGPIEEVRDKPIAQLVTGGTGEVLGVTPHHLQHGNGPAHSYYDLQWSNVSPSTGDNASGTISALLKNVGAAIGDIDHYTSYEVTLKLGGKDRTYRAIAFHSSRRESTGKIKTVIVDKITQGMNDMLADESPRVRSPWPEYVKTSLYLAVVKAIRKAERSGQPLILADATIGYLPGDDVTPDSAKERAFVTAAACPPPSTTVTTDDVVVIGWVNSNAIDLPSGANTVLIESLNDAVLCPPLVGAWASGLPLNLGSDGDRAYANAFLVKNSGNAEPPNASINPVAIQLGGDFRLFNRFQAQFSVSNGVISNPTYIQSVSQVGSTPFPCYGFPSFSGQPHPFNGTNGVVFGRTVYQLTEGRIGDTGRDVSETINGRTVPWIWSVIKFDASGLIDANDNAQIFPTYYVYKNGQLVQLFPQSPLSKFIKKDDNYQRQPWEIQ